MKEKFYYVVLEGGLVYRFTEWEFKGLRKAMAMSGKNFATYPNRDLGVLILLSKVIAVEEKEEEVIVNEPIAEPEVEETPQPETIEEAPEETPVEEKKPETKQERNDRLIAEMIEKSNCVHENQTVHVTMGKNGTRYFPVCDFCGQRFRYIKAADLSDEQKANAKVWES